MTLTEITLIIIGVIFLIGSFLVKDKLSGKDIQYISQLSEHELGVIVDKQIKNAATIVETKVDETIEETSIKTKRALEKETNEKIMAISQYSDTVLESMNTTHNEIMFLYSMLNDKHKDMSDLATRLQELSDSIKKTEHEFTDGLNATVVMSDSSYKDTNQNIIGNNISDTSTNIADAEVLIQPVVANVVENTAERIKNNHNTQILALHTQGVSDVNIAKELGLGLGEVKLVLGLYKGES